MRLRVDRGRVETQNRLSDVRGEKKSGRKNVRRGSEGNIADVKARALVAGGDRARHLH
jgi:hypothetical protein